MPYIRTCPRCRTHPVVTTRYDPDWDIDLQRILCETCGRATRWYDPAHALEMAREWSALRDGKHR